MGEMHLWVKQMWIVWRLDHNHEHTDGCTGLSTKPTKLLLQILFFADTVNTSASSALAFTILNIEASPFLSLFQCLSVA